MSTRNENDATLPIFQTVETQSTTKPMKISKEVQTSVHSNNYESAEDLFATFNQKLLIEKYKQKLEHAEIISKQMIEHTEILSKQKIELVKALCERDEARIEAELLAAERDLLSLKEKLRISKLQD